MLDTKKVGSVMIVGGGITGMQAMHFSIST